uniref:Uncharacterized protein n=1 Tax=Pseudomonas phage HRDY3 TaxID=3236930 RepID=A0AB39CEB8_9VIRU
MDYEFRQHELGTDADDERYAQWLATVGKKLGRDIVQGSDLESDLFDYYSDGCQPDEAVAEVLTLEEIQRNKSPDTCKHVLEYFSDKRLRLKRDEKLNRLVWSLEGTTHQRVTEANHLDHWSLFNWIQKGREFLADSKN